jgi:uncharacterized protein involved in response to NO
MRNMLGSAFLSLGFRPFFLAAGTWALVAIVLWVCVLQGDLVLPTRFAPVAWHVHEMLFGFVMAAVAGFLLTAIPNWTGRPPVAGWRLGGLLGLWALGRVVCLVSAWLPAWVSVAGDMAFPVALTLVATREIVAARNWRNLLVMAPVGLFGLANLLMHIEAMDANVATGLGWRIGLVAALILISIIAGRIVPAFTRNWSVKRGSKIQPPQHGWLDRVALGVLHTGLVAWAIWPDARLPGFGLIAGGALHGWRLVRWRGFATGAEPLLAILHVAYAWLVVGVVLLGVSRLDSAVPVTAAVHALTAGAIATMILAMMTRVSLGHSGRALTAGRSTVAIYALGILAALTRVGAAFAGDRTMTFAIVAAVFWIAAFAIFLVVYGRIFLTTVRRGPQ